MHAQTGPGPGSEEAPGSPATGRSPATVLILGGTAWLGAEVARACLAQGERVTCLARGRSGQPPPGTVLIPGDRDDAQWPHQLGDQDWDVVIDLTRVPGHAASAARALRARTQQALYISSCSVYADHSQPGADESGPVLPPLDTANQGDAADYGRAKAACEQSWLAGFGPERTTIVRPGLIAGPGDTSDRTGYWPARFAHPATKDGTVLVPAATSTDEASSNETRAPTDTHVGAEQRAPTRAPRSGPMSTQVIDYRDLAAWLAALVQCPRPGVYNAVGERRTLSDHLMVARSVAGHTGPLITADDNWLLAQGVAPWAGPRSLPLWLPDPEYAGFAARDGSRARAAGLVLRDLSATLSDTLAWELAQPADRPRRAGLTPEQECQLLESLRGGL